MGRWDRGCQKLKMVNFVLDQGIQVWKVIICDFFFFHFLFIFCTLLTHSTISVIYECFCFLAVVSAVFKRYMKRYGCWMWAVVGSQKSSCALPKTTTVLGAVIHFLLIFSAIFQNNISGHFRPHVIHFMHIITSVTQKIALINKLNSPRWIETTPHVNIWSAHCEFNIKKGTRGFTSHIIPLCMALIFLHMLLMALMKH